MEGKALRYLLVAVLSALCGVHFVTTCLERYRQGWISATLLYGFGSVISLFIALVCGDIARLQPAPTHTVKSLLGTYALLRITKLVGAIVTTYYKDHFRFPTQHQDKTLHYLLRQGQNTVYGREHSFSTINTREEYIKKVPITTYADYEPYVDRIKNGEDNVLTPYKVEYLVLTSGTTAKHGKRKAYPYPALKVFMKFFSWNAMPFTGYFARSFTEASPTTLGTTVMLRYRQAAERSPSGIPMGPLTDYASPSPKDLEARNTSPAPCFEMTSEKHALYGHALFALADPYVVRIDGFMAPLLYSFYQLLEDNWQDLCDNLENGYVSSKHCTDEDTKKQLEEYLISSPARAEELRTEFQKGFDGIAKRVWPRLERIDVILSGAFEIYAKPITEHYGKGIFHSSPFYGSSEGFNAMNITDPWATREIPYMLNLLCSFFEFIREEDTDKENPKTLFIDQIEEGKRYEIVVTTLFGLSRFRVGDVLKVVGRIDQTPQFVFDHRTGQALSVHSEKTSEAMLLEAIQKTVASLPGFEIKDYTSTEAVNLRQQHAEKDLFPDEGLKRYVLFVEMQKTGHQSQLTEDDKRLFERNLCKANENYEKQRQKGAIMEACVFQVRTGTFARLKDYMNSIVDMMQFKMPRVIRRPDCLDFLCDNMES